MTQRAVKQIVLFVLVGLLFVSGRASAEDAQGMLKVTTDKGAADVYLGVEKIGTTPLNQYLAEGSYTIRVLKDGFEPFVRKIQVRPNQATDVSARLFEGEGSVEFLVTPTGAELTLNGGKKPGRRPSDFVI